MSQFNKSDYHELEILKEVEESPLLNNRKAASKLGVSVKLAHEVLSRMVKKGLLHIKKEHSRRWDYFLTPKGLAQKARLTLSFLDFSMQFYREARRKSASLCRNMSESGVKEVILLGANELSEIVYLGMQEWGLYLDKVLDFNVAEGQKFMGVEVGSADNLSEYKGKDIIVCFSDPVEPLKEKFLPEGIEEMEGMRWVFEEFTRDCEY